MFYGILLVAAITGAEPTTNDKPAQGSSIIFVLDCSHSMNNPMPVRRNGINVKPRLELAKVSLSTMLQELANRGDTSVGVSFFAHRVGYQKGIGQRLEQPTWKGPIPPELQPQHDVERLLSLGRFGGAEAHHVRDQMVQLRAWGESPLYLAVVESLMEFQKKQPATRNEIIAIGDGGNHQSRGEKTDRADVIAAWKKFNVPIHFLDLGGQPAGQQPIANADVKAISEETNGVYQLVGSGDDLLRRLRQRSTRN